MSRQYKAFFGIFYVYWKVYGGVRAIIGSPYFHLSVAGAAIAYPLWWKSDNWAAITLGMLPNILGFSIGAFAIFLSFGQQSLERLKDKNEAQSRYLGVVAAFVHFIVVQTLALLVGFVGKAWPGPVLGLLGSILALYALVLAVAAAFRLFRLARIYNRMKAAAETVPPVAENDATSDEH